VANQSPDEAKENAAIMPETGSLASYMHVELVVNDQSEVWLLHDRPFPAILQWADYDQESGSLEIVTHDGVTRELGMVLPDKVRKLLLKAGKLYVIYMKNKQMQDFGIIPIMVRKTVFH